MTSPRAHVVVVGPRSGAADDGLAELQARLGAAGAPVVGRSYVEDDEAALESVLGIGSSLTVILTGGGAGADVVRRVLARVAGARLVLHDRLLAALTEAARRADRPLPRHAERLAVVPQGATVWPTAGGDPAWLLEAGGRAFAVLPRGGALGPILDRHLLPWVERRLGGRGAHAARTLRLTGVTLAEVEERLAGAPEPLALESGTVEVSAVPAEGDVWIRLRARAATPALAERALDEAEARLGPRLGEDCYGRDDESLERVVGRLLAARGLTLAVAESCTGGLLGHRLTNVPGASAYVERGVIVYSNRAKQELLGVPEAVLRRHGAVSAACAEAMAQGVVKLAGAACGVAITGIAGPEGGTADKPVGTVFVAAAVGGRVASRRYLFAGDRVSIKWQATQAALDLLRRRLLADAAPGPGSSRP